MRETGLQVTSLFCVRGVDGNGLFGAVLLILLGIPASRLGICGARKSRAVNFRQDVQEGSELARLVLGLVEAPDELLRKREAKGISPVCASKSREIIYSYARIPALCQ